MPTDKRYQVFVSSTYEDLRAERAEVMQALLELDCMPAGMELFPAANDEQWTWITRVIEESDYYLVLVGGRYGTIHPSQKLSYTELEYRHAVEIGKPVIAFLHGAPGEIPAAKTEFDPNSAQRLSEFRAYCEQRLCKYWTSPSDLGGKVSRSVTKLVKHHPAIGWMRGDLGSPEQEQMLSDLRRENTELRDRVDILTQGTASEEFAQGNDEFVLEFWSDTQQSKLNKNGIRYWVSGEGFWTDIRTNWNNVLTAIGGTLLVNPVEHDITRAFNEACMAYQRATPPALENDRIVSAVKVSSEGVERVRTQLLALGLISVEKSGYDYVWSLTEFGKKTVYGLIAAKKKPPLRRRPRRS